MRIERELNAYYGQAFERLVRDMLRRKLLNFGQRRVARWWHRGGQEIDAILELEDGLLFVEVKWKDLKRKEAEKVLGELKRKAEGFEGNKRYLLVARRIEGKGENMLDLRDLEDLVR